MIMVNDRIKLYENNKKYKGKCNIDVVFVSCKIKSVVENSIFEKLFAIHLSYFSFILLMYMLYY